MNDRVKVGNLSDLTDGECQSVDINGRRILIANVNGKIYAVEGICTHEDADLGTMTEGKILCTVHLSQFDVKTGNSLNPPATGPLRTFNVKLENDDIYVDLPETGKD